MQPHHLWNRLHSPHPQPLPPSPPHVTCDTTQHRDTTLKLSRKIEDLEDVRNIMAVLKEVREKESEIDNLIGPIEEMYALLMRYEVRLGWQGRERRG